MKDSTLKSDQLMKDKVALRSYLFNVPYLKQELN